MEAAGSEDRLQAAKELLATRLRPAAILQFGSRASGRATAASDRDLGLVGIGSPVDALELARLRVSLEEILGTPVDLVVLDEASPILRMEVLRNHEVLAMADRERFEDFTVRTLREYFDLKAVRKPIEDAIFSTEHR